MAKPDKELERKLAQMFMIGVPGLDLEAPARKFFEEYAPGGVLYFAENYDSPVQVFEYSQELQRTCAKNGLPLFIAVDHEGGKVQRFKKPFTHFPEPYVIGACDSPKLAFQVAEVMAKELRAVGVNIDFYPLCDIHTKPNNPIIGKRAFGVEPEIVERISSAMVRGFIAGGMVSTCKHFPGHGDTTVDSHKDLPKVEQTWEELLERELRPFIKCIKGRVDMIMTAHILNPKIDPIYPATLSYTTLTAKLRKELRFQRIIISDDMQMDAISKHYGPEDAIDLAIKAGSDMFIYRDFEAGRAAIETALKFLADGRIDPELVEASYARIQEVKQRVLVPQAAPRIEDYRAVIGCEAHQTVLAEILEKAKEKL